jgi:hypothetical protein
VFERSASKSEIDCPSTPAAPWLAFTFLKASQTSRFGTSNGLALFTGLLPLPVGRGAWLNNAILLVQSYYRTFIPTTNCSAPVPRVGTLILADLAAWIPPFTSGLAREAVADIPDLGHHRLKPLNGKPTNNVMVWTPPTQRHRGAIAWSS